MKKILDFIKTNFIMFVKSAWYVILAAIIGTIAGFIWDFTTGFLTFFGLGIAFILFIWFRQLLWWFTKTGDYKKMKLVIPKNMRRPFPYFGIFSPILIKKDESLIITKNFKFTDSTIYRFDDEDQFDVNKLFGFSIGMHHNNSIRFGWRPNGDLSKIEIVGYEYHDKLRIPTLPICEIDLNKWYEFTLKYNHNTNYVEYIVTDGNHTNSMQHPIKLKNKINFGYKLDLYFGGNKKAPHKMIFYKE